MWQASTAEWENGTESADQSFLSSAVHGTFGDPDKLCLQHVTYSIPNSMYPLESGTSRFTKIIENYWVSGASSDVFQEVLYQEDKQGSGL